MPCQLYIFPFPSAICSCLTLQMGCSSRLNYQKTSHIKIHFLLLYSFELVRHRVAHTSINTSTGEGTETQSGRAEGHEADPFRGSSSFGELRQTLHTVRPRERGNSSQLMDTGIIYCTEVLHHLGSSLK